MKRLLLTYFMLFLTLNIVVAGEKAGQPLLQKGKVWNYDYTYVDISFQRHHGSATYWTEGDTIVDGRQLFWMCFSNSEEEGQVFRQLWYEKDGKVYTCDDKGRRADLVYDFTLSTGDNAPDHTVSAFFPDGIKVVSADSILVRGILRKRLSLANPEWETGSEEKTTWVEGVGGTKGLDEPVMRMVGDGREYTLLSCFVGNDCIFEKEDFEAPPYRKDIHASTLAKDGRAWVVRMMSGSSDEMLSYYVDGDTVIGGHSCKRVMRQTLVPRGTASYDAALYEEGRKVWRCAAGDSTLSLFYDFSAESGEDVVLREGEMVVEGYWIGRTVLTVGEVDCVSVDGKEYRRQHVYDYRGKLVDIWVEGIGGLKPFFGGWIDGDYVIVCMDGCEEVFSRNDFTRTDPDESPFYHRLLATGKKWNQSCTDRSDPGMSYLFDYEIKADTVIGGVRHYKLYGHNLDNRVEETRLGLLLEIGRRVYCIPSDNLTLSNPLLYDFGLQKGGRMPFYYLPNYICVLDCDEICHGGDTLRRLGMSYEPFSYTSSWNPVNRPLDWWVESIGSSTDFLRPYQWSPARHCRLESCTLGGDTLFTHADFGIPEMSGPDQPEVPYHPMLTEGKMWLYHFTQGYTDPVTGEMRRTEYDVTYTLRGDTVIGGREYRKMYEDHEGSCGYHSAWREDGRKVFVAYPGGKDSLCYDYGLPYLGQAPYTSQNGIYYAAYLAARDVIQAGGEYHNRFWLISADYEESGCWVDGVGSDNGLIYPNHFTNFYMPFWRFVSCTMPDGAVVTATDLYGEAVSYEDGIRGTAGTPRIHGDGRIYDLQGRQLVSPPQKGIYIKDGKKFVVR